MKQQDRTVSREWLETGDGIKTQITKQPANLCPQSLSAGSLRHLYDSLLKGIDFMKGAVAAELLSSGKKAGKETECRDISESSREIRDAS